jgi:hypothetical protein
MQMENFELPGWGAALNIISGVIAVDVLMANGGSEF